MRVYSIEDARSLLIRDIIAAGEEKWQKVTRMNLLQTVEYVINRRNSIGMYGVPCWLWGDVCEDDGYPWMDLASGRYYSGLWINDKRGGGSRFNVRYNAAAEQIDNVGTWETVFGDQQTAWRCEKHYLDMIEHGIAFGQSVLVRAEAHWSHSYYDNESDFEWSSEVIYVDGEPEEGWMDKLLVYARHHDQMVEERAAKTFATELAHAKRKSSIIPTPQKPKNRYLRY